MSLGPRYVPDFRLTFGGEPAPAALRASITSITHESDLDGADRVEIGLANENLRWLDHELLRLGQDLKLEIGYADGELTQIFVGEVVAQSATFSGGTPTLSVSAQDRISNMQKGSKQRSFRVPAPNWSNLPVPDPIVATLVALENGLVAKPDAVASAIDAIVYGLGVAIDPEFVQGLVRTQPGEETGPESDFQFLTRIARENGWELMVDHKGPLAGYTLRLYSIAQHLDADVTLRYGLSLLDFSPRVSDVGQVEAISARVPVHQINTTFLIKIGWDWNRSMLTFGVAIDLPGPIDPAAKPSFELNEAMSLYTAPRKLLSELIPMLNERLTATGSTVGDPRIIAGAVIRVEGVGEQFGGLYRVTSSTHKFDSGGFQTSFEVRKEIWFGAIPLAEQGAIRIGADVAFANDLTNQSLRIGT